MVNKLNGQALAGIKLFAIIGMICFHAGMIQNVGYGGFACIFFFIVSGFTTAYWHHKKLEIDSTSMMNYYKKKISSIYFPYYTAFLLSIPLVAIQVKSLDDAVEVFHDSFFHLLFIQCWFPNITYKFNAVAWFTGSILFCYLLTPILLIFLNRTNSVKICFGGIVLLSLVHLFLEFCSITYPDIFIYSMHTNPLIKCIEYVLGMLLAILYKSMKCNIRNSKVIFTFFELCSLLASYLVALVAVECGYKSIMLVPLMILVIVFGIGQGYISSFFEYDFIQGISKKQGYVYLFHYIVIQYSYSLLSLIGLKMLTGNKILFSLMCIVLTIIASYFLSLVSNKLSMIKSKCHN